MRIYFERTGGFAGITLTTIIDTAGLPQEDAQKLRKMLDEAAFFKLHSKILPSSPQADRFQYKLKVEGDGFQHTVIVSEEAMPAGLTPLIKWLMAAVRKER